MNNNMKKTTLMLLIALVMTLSLCIPALAETAPAQVVVSGNATVTLQADRATIEIGAQTRGETVSQAQQENAQVMEKLIAKLKELGIAREDIVTSQFNVYFEQPGGYPDLSATYPKGNYNVTNMISITIRDLSQVSTVIDQAALVGANNIYNLSFQASKANEAYQKALVRAVEDAREKALVLAQASGRELGEVQLISANDSYGYGYGIQNTLAMKDAQAQASPILSGDIAVNANVTITYNLK